MRADENGLLQLEAMKAAVNSMHIGAAEARLSRLAGRLDKFDRTWILGIMGGLLTEERLHAKTVRIEMLAHLAALRCKGNVRPSPSQVREWLNDILSPDSVGLAEDPVEDVFVANVVSGGGNTRVFEGLFESNAAFLQSCLRALTECAREGHEWAGHCLRQASALLRLSEAVAERAGVRRNAVSEGQPRGRAQLPATVIADARARVVFTNDELEALGIKRFDLLPFDFSHVDVGVLRSEGIGWTGMEARPVLLHDEGVVLLLPTAVSAAIRRRAIALAVASGASAAFEKPLTDQQFHMCTMQGIRGLGVKLKSQPIYDEVTRFGQAIGTFDDGAHIHVVFAQNSVAEAAEEGFTNPYMIGQPLTDLVKAHAEGIAVTPGYRCGLTIVVFGGVGRGTGCEFVAMPNGWRCTALGYDDLMLLGWDGDSSALRLHRLLQQEIELEARGVKVINGNGVVNLYAYAHEQEFVLVPEKVALGGSTLLIAPSYIGLFRKRLRQVLDHHVVHAPDGPRYLEVQRPATHSFFKGGTSEPVYASITHAEQGELLACAEVGGRAWWISAPSMSGARERDLVYRTWDMAKNWLARTSSIVEERLPGVPTPVVQVHLSFPELDQIDEDFLLAGGETGVPVVTAAGSRISIECGNTYLRAFARPENIGDRRMIEAIVAGAAILANVTMDDGEVAQLARLVVPDQEARFLHIFATRTPTEVALAAQSTPEPRLIQEEVRAWCDLGFAHALGAGGSSRRKLLGEDALALTKAAVEHLWGRARARLGALDRKDVVARCLANHDALDRDRRTWRHTAAAVLQLNADPEDVVGAALNREHERGRASLASRVVAEMAICTSPIDGGSACSDDDLDNLLALVAAIVDVANRRDEIHYGFSSEGLTIEPNGTFSFGPSFAMEVQRPYTLAHGRKQFLAAADDYAALHDAPTELSDEDYANNADPIFDAAFQAEYGLNPLKFVDLLWRLIRMAMDAGSTIASFKRSELVDAVAEITGTDVAAARAVFDALSLVPRTTWDEDKPDGASAKDWFPWRYSRRLSLIARPIAQLDLSDDPACLVSVLMAEHAFDFAMRSRTAGLPGTFFRSKEMKRWIGSAIDGIGHRFNHRVCDRLIELGLKAVPECKMNRLGGIDGDGDVDVLTWDPADGRIFVIECKRLLMDRTVGEIAERLQEYAPDHVSSSGKRGPTRKHLDRLVIIQANLPALAKVTGVAQESMKLVSCLVTGEMVPMQFQASFAAFAKVVAYDDLDTIVG